MADPYRLESPASSDPAARDSRAETLLLEGLDHYFAASYEDAIHLWTRVLFLDRTHSRARAYIDRARTAIAERQRHDDELLEGGYELLGQGRTRAARHLLDEVVAGSGEDERALALRLRLDRLEQLDRLKSASAARVPQAEAPVVAPAWRSPIRSRGMAVLVVLSCVAVALAAFVGPGISDWVGLRNRTDAPLATPPPWPLLSTSEVGLVRARNAFSRGQLADALHALERVSVESPVRGDADALRLRIQRAVAARAPGRQHPEAGRR